MCCSLKLRIVQYQPSQIKFIMNWCTVYRAALKKLSFKMNSHRLCNSPSFWLFILSKQVKEKNPSRARSHKGFPVANHCTSHISDKRFYCTEPGCEKSYKTIGDLNIHKRTHIGDDNVYGDDLFNVKAKFFWCYYPCPLS